MISLPEGPGRAKVGVDDWLVAGHTVEDLLALARPWDGRGPGLWWSAPHRVADSRLRARPLRTRTWEGPHA